MRLIYIISLILFEQILKATFATQFSDRGNVLLGASEIFQTDQLNIKINEEEAVHEKGPCSIYGL